MRRCSTCRQILPLDDFGRDAYGIAGRRASCRDCTRARRRGPKGCAVCHEAVGTKNGRRFCDNHAPPVCCCARPDPDAIGECRSCHLAYRTRLLELRAEWIAFYASHGLKIVPQR